MTNVFSLKKNMVKHEWKHTDEKTYLSSQCDTFIWNQRMVEHQSIQIRGEAISMQPCDKYFSQQKKDGKIPMNSWIHIEKKPCYCSQC